MKELICGSRISLVDDDDYFYLRSIHWRVRTLGTNLKHRYVVDKTGKTISEYIIGKQPGMVIDHIDGNTLNNTRSNLRFCTHQQNVWNQAKTSKKTNSIFKGVCLHKPTGKWMAYIRHKHLGLFDHEYLAAKKYDEIAKLVFGEFARLNFRRGDVL